MQKVPDIEIIQHEGDLVCDECKQEASFLIGPAPINDGKNRCKVCMALVRPDCESALTDFSDLLELMLEMKSRMMTTDMMHKLYGNHEEPEDG